MSGTEPRILVVAGHDPSGGAGIDADREAATTLGVTIDVVVTARTDQDASAVRSVGARSPDTWLAEAVAAAARSRPGALKFGLLPGAEHVEAAVLLVQRLLRLFPRLAVVVDPIVASSSGFRFLDDAGVAALRDRLGALDVVLTPNVPELALLAGADAEALAGSIEQRVAAARRLLAGGARAVVAKGGHGGEDPLVDLVLERGAAAALHLTRPRVKGRPRGQEAAPLTRRGTGCRFATALACGLALGPPLATAAERAGALVAAAVAAAVPDSAAEQRS